jgi:Xaa-Pro aminopeptidase
VGFGWHEEPRIVPASAAVLEPGMVVALEPGGYRDGVGIRIEVVAVVTAGGARVLSQHDLRLAGGA